MLLLSKKRAIAIYANEIASVGYMFIVHEVNAETGNKNTLMKYHSVNIGGVDGIGYERREYLSGYR